jgi:hypothetical protein
MEPMNDESPQALFDIAVVGKAAFKEDWIGKIVFALPKYTPSPSFGAFGHSPQYYKTRHASDAALQEDSIEALIVRDRDVKTICAGLLRNNDGTIDVDSHPDFENSANVRDSDVWTSVAGHFPSTCQGIDGVMTEDGETTCLTFEQFLAACQKIDPYWTLLHLWYSDDFLPLKLPFENAKGQPFSAMLYVFTKFTEDEWIAVISTRCHHYCQHFIDMLEQRCKVFRIVFYGDGKYSTTLRGSFSTSERVCSFELQ